MEEKKYDWLIVEELLNENAELIKALTDLLNAKMRSRTTTLNAGEDKDVYYNGADFGEEEDRAWILLGKMRPKIYPHLEGE